MMSNNVTAVLIVGILFAVLPIMIVWLVMRYKKNATDKRTEIILSALEKNPNVDPKTLEKMMTATAQGGKNSTIKERLLRKLVLGIFGIIVGLGLFATVVVAAYAGGFMTDSLYFKFLFGAVFFALGIAFLVSYFVGKKMLAKEMEQEANQKQAND